MRNTGYWWNNYFWSTNQKTYFVLRPIWNTSIGWIDKLNTRSLRNKNVAFLCLFTCSLRTLWMTRDWNGEFDLPADALSTPSSFHCCLSQDPITNICLSALLSSVLLEWRSSDLPPNLVKRELASTPTLSLDFLRKQSNTWLESKCLIQTTNERMTLTS